MEQFKARFEDENKNVTIDFQSIPWADYWGKLASAIAAGKGSTPDVFQIPMGLVEEYVARQQPGAGQQSCLDGQGDRREVPPWTVQRGKKGNDYYGLPLDVQTLLIYRNNKLYKEAGLDPKAPFMDLNDLYEQSVKLTKKNGGTDRPDRLQHQLLQRLSDDSLPAVLAA